MRKLNRTLLLSAAATCLAAGAGGVAFAQGSGAGSTDYGNNGAGISGSGMEGGVTGSAADSQTGAAGTMQEEEQISSSQLTSSQIQQVQESLRNEGYSVNIDGVWGPETSEALRSFQQENDLQASGNLDTQTLSELDLPEIAEQAQQQQPGQAGQPEQPEQQTDPFAQDSQPPEQPDQGGAF